MRDHLVGHCAHLVTRFMKTLKTGYTLKHRKISSRVLYSRVFCPVLSLAREPTAQLHDGSQAGVRGWQVRVRPRRARQGALRGQAPRVQDLRGLQG